MRILSSSKRVIVAAKARRQRKPRKRSATKALYTRGYTVDRRNQAATGPYSVCIWKSISPSGVCPAWYGAFCGAVLYACLLLALMCSISSVALRAPCHVALVLHFFYALAISGP